jgi:hypothetical protein
MAKAASGFATAGLVVLAGCQATAPGGERGGSPTDLPLMGGYRDADDACRRVGEDRFTNAFLDDAADLVACPEGTADLSGLGPDTGARVVAAKDGWVLISVPRR